MESLGVYLPPTVRSTQQIVESMTNPPLFSLEEITGIKNRRVYSEGDDSFQFALRAARDCLSRSRYSASELDVVIVPSISRSMNGKMMCFEPSFAALLARELGAHTAIHFDLSNACAGMMTGVYILDRMIKAGVVRNGLVVSGERITPIAEVAVKEISEPLDAQFGSLTVGDSGAAVIVDRAESEEDKIHYVELMTCAEYSHLCIGKPSDKNIGPALYTNNQEMHKKDRVQMWPRMHSDLLKKMGKTFAEEKFDYIVQHQVGAKAIRNFTKVGAAIFEAEMPESLSVVEELGNTATTSHFVVLYEHLRQKRLKKGAKVLLVPAASGLVTGCVSVTISSLTV
jgi:3-oxoacyl-[acyl-carrier-protein] synthase-3